MGSEREEFWWSTFTFSELGHQSWFDIFRRLSPVTGHSFSFAMANFLGRSFSAAQKTTCARCCQLIRIILRNYFRDDNERQARRTRTTTSMRSTLMPLGGAGTPATAI